MASRSLSQASFPSNAMNQKSNLSSNINVKPAEKRANNANRKPLQSIDLNVATRVQPPREAKKKQAFSIFVDDVEDVKKSFKESQVVERVDFTEMGESKGSSSGSSTLIPSFMDVDEEFADTVIPESPMDSSLMEIPAEEPKKEQDGEESIYSTDVYQYLLAREKTQPPKPRYMAKQTDINHSMRTILIDWLVEVCEELQLHNETLYIAVNLTDRFLSKMLVLRAKLQLVGATALFIAAKYEEIYPPGVKDFIYLTDDCYSVEQLFRMEDLMLRVLEYDVSCPSPSFFLTHFNKWADNDDVTSNLATYIVELTATHGETCLKYMPSTTVASAVCLARHTLGYEALTNSWSLQTGFSGEDLKPCVKDLAKLLAEASGADQQAVREKFSKTKYLEVSLLNPPNSLPF